MIQKDLRWTREPSIGEPGWKSSNVGQTLRLCGYRGLVEGKETGRPFHPFGGHGQNTCLGIRPGSKYGETKGKRHQRMCGPLPICL